MRIRDTWFWLGGACLTLGAVLTAIAIAYYTKQAHYPLSTGPQMTFAYIAFLCAFLCFFAAIAGWRPLRKLQRFPDITVRIQGWLVVKGLNEPAPGFTTPCDLVSLKFHFTNNEIDRRVSITALQLQGRIRPGSDTELPWWPLLPIASGTTYQPNPPSQVTLPLNLEPLSGGGGWVTYELTSFTMQLMEWPGGVILKLVDSVTNKVACCGPLAVGGAYSRRQGLWRATAKEAINGPVDSGTVDLVSWHGILGPPDP